MQIEEEEMHEMIIRVEEEKKKRRRNPVLKLAQTILGMYLTYFEK